MQENTLKFVVIFQADEVTVVQRLDLGFSTHATKMELCWESLGQTMKSCSLWPPKPGAALWASLHPLLQPWPHPPQPLLISLHSHLCGNLGGISLSVNPRCIFVPKQRGLNAPDAFSSLILGQEPSVLKWSLYFMWLFPPHTLYCLSESLRAVWPPVLISQNPVENLEGNTGIETEVLAKFCLLLLKNLLWVISLRVDPEQVKPQVGTQPSPELLGAVVLANSFNSPSKIFPKKHPLLNCPCRAPG